MNLNVRFWKDLRDASNGLRNAAYRRLVEDEHLETMIVFKPGRVSVCLHVGIVQETSHGQYIHECGCHFNSLTRKYVQNVCRKA